MEITPNKIVNTQPVQAPTQIKTSGNKPPKRHSNFFITLNTQKNINALEPDAQEELKKKFEDVLDEFFKNKLKDLIKLQGSKTGAKFGWPVDCTREELESRVEKVKVDYVIEIGPQSGKLHSHAIICFAKRAVDTKLDYTGIREYFAEKMGFDIYLKSVIYNDAQANLKSYIEKNPVN